MYLLRLMLVGVWLGLLWVLFYFFDHYIQSSGFFGYYFISSIIIFKVQFLNLAKRSRLSSTLSLTLGLFVCWASRLACRSDATALGLLCAAPVDSHVAAMRRHLASLHCM